MACPADLVAVVVVSVGLLKKSYEGPNHLHVYSAEISEYPQGNKNLFKRIIEKEDNWFYRFAIIGEENSAHRRHMVVCYISIKKMNNALLFFEIPNIKFNQYNNI